MLNHNLRIFLKVAELGSVTEVAEELYISQPAVSKALRNLEEELKLKLFYRDRRKGLILTDSGREILLIARQMEELEERMYQTAYRANNFIGGRVRIASMPILTSVILAPVFHEYRTRYPQVKIELIEDNSMGIRRAVEEHQADFAILSSPFGELDSEILFHDRMIAACNASAGKTSILDLNEKPERFIFCKAGHETTMEILRAHNVNISGSFIVEQPETAVKLAENGNGIAVLSDFVLDNIPNNLVRIPLTPEINMDIGLAANDLHGLTPVAEELRRMISEFTPGIHSKPV